MVIIKAVGGSEEESPAGQTLPSTEVLTRTVVKEVEVPKIVEVEKRVEVPIEKIVEKIVEKVVEVEPPARTEIVVPEVVEPVASVPPARSPKSIFGGLDKDGLAALEAAAQREIARGRRFGLAGNIFGRKH